MTSSARELRAAVETVLAVVRADAEDDPPRPVPGALRPYVGFTKNLPAAAVSAVCRCVDDQANLRERAKAKTTADQVGDIGWLWLDRPDGWEAEIESIRERSKAAKGTGSKEGNEKSDDRKSQRAERAAATAKARADRAEADVERLKRDLVAARKETRAAEKEIDVVQSDLARLQDERSRAVRELKDVESDSAQRLGAVRALEQELAELREQYEELETAHTQSTASLKAAERTALDEAVSAAPAEAGAEENGPESPVGPAFDQSAVAATISAAAASVASLSEHLSALGTLFGPPSAPDRPIDAAPLRAKGAPARRPQRLPVGMFDDGPEAVQHLIRVAGAVLLVDGYNVSISGWPDMVLTEQRRRLVDALDTLAARSGITPYVVFDGVDPDGGLHARSGPAPVRVRFAPARVEADDILIALTAEYPPTTPIIVASSDKRVQDGCRANGANIISSAQLLEALR